jgi:hypothetical protein
MPARVSVKHGMDGRIRQPDDTLRNRRFFALCQYSLKTTNRDETRISANEQK